jgi:hypothetical protein
VVMTRTVLWNITPCLLKFNRHFGRIFRLHLQGRICKETSCYLLHVCISLGFFFDPEDSGDMFLSNVGCVSKDYIEFYPRIQYFSSLNYFVVVPLVIKLLVVLASTDSGFQVPWNYGPVF